MISPPGGRSVILPDGDRRPSISYRRALIQGRRMARRRRNVKVLLGLAALTALSAAAGGPGGFAVHLAVDLALALYLTFLIEGRRRRMERTMKVHRLDKARANSRRRVAEEFSFNEPVAARRRA
jgi:hypothetical protein